MFIRTNKIPSTPTHFAHKTTSTKRILLVPLLRQTMQLPDSIIKSYRRLVNGLYLNVSLFCNGNFSHRIYTK